jgi:2'-5' RNA ligase
MYAVVALFDDKSEKKIEAIWHDLAWRGFSTHIQQLKGIRPHMTLAHYHTLPLNRIPIYIQAFCQMTKPLSIVFSSLGSFPSSRTLFLSPTITTELLYMHTSYHTVCDSFKDINGSLYVPQRWVPHCTLANYLTLEELGEAFTYCATKFSPIEATITSIGIVRTTFEDGKCTRYQPVIELPLQSGFSLSKHI